MRKLVMVGVMVGSLLAGFGSAMAQTVPCSATPAVPCVQGGIGDPLTLAASGVLIPYLTEGGIVALLEVASPVSNNPNLHMRFFNATCALIGPSVGMPLTTNDIAFQQIGVNQGGPVPAGTNGLVGIAATGLTGFDNSPLEAPIHSRVYLFNAADGTSRVIEPIVLDTAEFPGSPHTWSPLRTAATFFSPLQTATVHTHLVLVCPRSTIQGGTAVLPGYFGFGTPPAIFSSNGFPLISPIFPPIATILRARIYDTNEVFKRNVENIPCDCLSQKFLENAADISDIYSSLAEVPFGTYTELEVDPTLVANQSSFTGYRSIFTVGSPLNNFFGRLSNGSRPSIQGTLTNTR